MINEQNNLGISLIKKVCIFKNLFRTKNFVLFGVVTSSKYLFGGKRKIWKQLYIPDIWNVVKQFFSYFFSPGYPHYHYSAVLFLPCWVEFCKFFHLRVRAREKKKFNAITYGNFHILVLVYFLMDYFFSM